MRLHKIRLKTKGGKKGEEQKIRVSREKKASHKQEKKKKNTGLATERCGTSRKENCLKVS